MGRKQNGKRRTTAAEEREFKGDKGPEANRKGSSAVSVVVASLRSSLKGEDTVIVASGRRGRDGIWMG